MVEALLGHLRDTDSAIFKLTIVIVHPFNWWAEILVADRCVVYAMRTAHWWKCWVGLQVEVKLVVLTGSIGETIQSMSSAGCKLPGILHPYTTLPVEQLKDQIPLRLTKVDVFLFSAC